MLKINSFDLFEVSSYLFLWTTLYFVLCLWNSARSYEWHCRIVTTIHAITVSSLAIYCTFYLSPWPFTDAGGPNSPMQVRTVSLCLGYFIFDVVWCLYFRTEGLAMMAHHILSLIGLAWSLLTGYYGTELVATVGGAEITNPLLQLRWFLRETGRQNTNLAVVVDWTFMLLFGFMRIILGSLLLYCYYRQDTPHFGRFGGTCIYVISWIFFISIVNYAVRKYSRSYRSWRSGPLPSQTDNFPSCNGDSGGKVNYIIKDQDIPSQREIKNGNKELTLRNNCVVKESIES